MEAEDITSISPINFSDDFYGLSPTVTNPKCLNRQLPEPDLQILTSDGLLIPAHSGILASVSPVLQNIIDRPTKGRGFERVLPIPGVPRDAVVSFLSFLYSSRCNEKHLEKYGIHLLVLSHAYLVPELKQRCSKNLAQRLTIENVVDTLQLARLCDAPDLYLKGMKFVSNNLEDVEKTEGWKFLQDHDPWLELDILQFMNEADLRKKRERKQRQERSLYLQLSEAMECLEHICREGCTSVGPSGVEPKKKAKREPCTKFSTCHGLQLLIKHFVTCNKRRVHGDCLRCKRMWQLLRLHSFLCDQPDFCKVPLCRQFKLRMEQEKRKDDARWKLLVKKVVSAKVISSLSVLNRKRSERMQLETNNTGS